MKHIYMRYYFLIVVCVIVGSDTSAQLMIYRKLPAFSLSGKYTVEVKQGSGTYQDIHTYEMNNNETGMVTKVDHFAPFAFDPQGGSVSIRVSLKNGANLTASTVELVNKTYTDVTTSFESGKFVITTPSTKRHFFVRLKSDHGNPLTVFTDPIALTPIPSGAKVKTFTASSSPYVQNAQYDRYTVPNDIDAVVIEDGAVVKGTIHTDNGRTKPLIVQGRGVILGNGPLVSGTSGIPYNALEVNHGNGHTLEGIFIIKSRHFCVRMSENAHIDNVKMYGYNANIDGIVAGKSSLIENCFFKVNDDYIKLYNDDMKVRNCNFYVQKNGAIFQFAWNSIKPGSNCLAEDCEVLAVEYTGCGDPKQGTGGIAHCFISLRESDANPVSGDNVFRNIYVQGQLIRFIGINGKYDSSKPLSLKNITLENITVEKKPTNYSWIYTGNAPHEISFTFRNVTLGGSIINKNEFHTEGNVILDIDPVSIKPVITSDNTFSNTCIYQSISGKSLHVITPDYNGNFLLQLFSTQGRRLFNSIYSKGTTVIDLKGFSPGMYTVRLTDTDDHYARRIVIGR